MRQKVSRMYKKSTLNGEFDFGSLADIIGSVASGVGSVVTATQGGGGSIYNPYGQSGGSGTPYIINTGGQQQPAAQSDNTLLYAGMGFLGLLTIGGIMFAVTRPSGGGHKR
jgi:hypothetical protein